MLTITDPDLVFINADDNFINRLVVSKILMKNQLKVEEAENGSETLEMIERNHGKKIILLLDLNMPLCDGYEVIKRMMLNPEYYALVKTIVISGTFYNEFKKKGLDAGIQAYIEKPFTENELMIKINDCYQEIQTCSR